MVLLFLMALDALVSVAQPSVDWSRMETNYPGSVAVFDEIRSNFVVKMSKSGSPVMEQEDYESLFLLADNATAFSESKEYFNARYEVTDFEAYSLVPVNNSYRKYPVTSHTRVDEVGSDVFYDDYYSYLFHFPSITKGCKLVTTSARSGRDVFSSVIFYFGRSIPVDQTKLTITLPDEISIIYSLFGADTGLINFSKTRNGKLTTYSWSASSLRAYEEDDESPSMRHFTPHIIIQLAEYRNKDGAVRVLGSLDDLYNWYYSKTSGLNKTPSFELKHLADSLTANLSSDREKARQIFRWVQYNIKYIAFEEGDNGIIPRDANIVLHRRYGDCKDKSSLIRALLDASGLKSSFAWVGTRSLPYKYSQFPGSANANHMIAIWWDEADNPVILDGTVRYQSLGEIPASIQGQQCLIGRGPEDFLLYEIPVSRPEDNITDDTIRARIGGGALRGTGFVRFTGEDKADMLTSLDRLDTEYRYAQALVNLLPKASNKFAYTNAVIPALDADMPLTLSYGFTLDNYITRHDGAAYVNLNINRLMNEVEIKPGRRNPVEFYAPFLHRVRLHPGNTRRAYC